MKSTNTKKYIWSIILCAIIVVLAYSTITGVYLASVLRRYEQSTNDHITEYAARLKNVDVGTVKNMTSSSESLELYVDLIDPSIGVILYEKRVDNTADYNTLDEFLRINKVGMTGVLDTAQAEDIAGVHYVTYEFRLKDNYYVKLAMPSGEIEHYYVDYGIALAIFILTVTLVSAIIIVVYNRLILENVKKQHEFMNDMSHEIRTPLTIIKGNLENILAVPENTIMDVAENIESSLKEVDHLTSLSQNLLNIVSDTRTAVNKRKTYNLSDTISSVLEVYSDIISGSEKTLIANIDSVDAVVDMEKIKQLVIILLDNAIKYTKPKDKIRVQLKRETDGFSLVVADTGIGIAPEDRERIFERFYRGANAITESGTGLGLSIAMSIVESHGGRISASQNIPSGLVISVFIPNKE